MGLGALIVCCWVATALYAIFNGLLYVHHWGAVGADAHAYWLAGRSAHLYGSEPGQPNAFLYSPLFAQCMRPLALLPWPVFLALWMASETAAFCWLVAGVHWIWRVPLLLLASNEILWGNVYGFMAVAVVIGFRCPAAWSFPLLTKITPALPGALWFALRGEWRKLWQFAGTSVALVTVSAAVAPQLWIDWFHYLMAHRGQSGIAWIRMLVAVPLIVLAARFDKPGLLPFACLLWLPRWSGSLKDATYAIGAARCPRTPARSPRVVQGDAGSPSALP